MADQKGDSDDRLVVRVRAIFKSRDDFIPEFTRYLRFYQL